MKALLGKKIGMTQVFSGDALIPVTVVEAGPCVVTQVKSREKEGYEAVQIGFKELEEKKVNKPMAGHFKKAKVKPTRHLTEYRLKKGEEVPRTGTKISCDIFEVGELADISAVSKGKGFQGVMKRWGFSGGPGGHGSHFHRSPGSVGMAATPSRVLKGMKMAGQTGNKKVTVKNLEIVKVDPDQNIILVKGAVPGGKGAILVLKETGRKVKTPVKLVEQEEKKQTVEEQTVDSGKQTVEKEKEKKQTEKQAVDSGRQTVEEKKDKVQKSKSEEEEKQAVDSGQQTVDKEKEKKKNEKTDNKEQKKENKEDN